MPDTRGSVGKITGAVETDIIAIETKMGTWETVGST